MLNDKAYNPVVLWKRLEAYYNTNLNSRAFRQLVELRLDSSSNATKFISDYCDCVQRFRKIIACMAYNKGTLRILLLVGCNSG